MIYWKYLPISSSRSFALCVYTLSRLIVVHHARTTLLTKVVVRKTRPFTPCWNACTIALSSIMFYAGTSSSLLAPLVDMFCSTALGRILLSVSDRTSFVLLPYDIPVASPGRRQPSSRLPPTKHLYLGVGFAHELRVLVLFPHCVCQSREANTRMEDR